MRVKEPEHIIKARWDKKKDQIEMLSVNIRKLRYNIATDLKSDNEKIFITALVVAIMDKTAERVGNDVSAGNGHYGVTCFEKKHIKISGNKITLDYIGKSGVEHSKSFSDEKIATCLKKALKLSKSKYAFETSEGFRIKADRVNRYLSDFGVRAKDIRGYSANRWMLEKLKDNDVDSNEKKRKSFFMRCLKQVASKVGHGKSTLRTHYLIPELEINYIKNGSIIDLSDREKYEDGGEVMYSGVGKKNQITIQEKVDFVISKDGLLKTDDLEFIIGKKADYPIQYVGDMKFKKCFLRPFYKKIK